MPMPNNFVEDTGFHHGVDEESDIGAAASRVHAIMTPQEAQVLIELLDNTKMKLEEREVNKESLQSRLEIAAGGMDGPSSGHPLFYQ